MYVARIRVKNYRAFSDLTIEFNPGVTVLIGENNSGKTALLRAMALVLQRSGRSRPTIDDFYLGIAPTQYAPEITVELTLRSSNSDTNQDRALVATWLTKTQSPWEAQLTYRYFLPEADQVEFARQMQDDADGDGFWQLLDLFLPRHVSRIYGGDPETLLRAEPDLLDCIDLRILEALRDAEAVMLTGQTPLLRAMLSRVLDRTTTPSGEGEDSKVAFQRGANSLISNIRGRLDVDSLFHLVEATGAKDGGEPKLGGRLTEDDLIAALKLMVDSFGLTVPISHNGLGYNNLLYISLVLASIDFQAREVGENAKVFPVLAIEEPEAHLHPSMQYKLLRYLSMRLNTQDSSRQLFVSTHSTHVTAAADLDSIVCMSIDASGARRVCYPGRVFKSDIDGQRSKKYVERYLDATKSSMLFAKGILFVEGITEQLLLPIMAEIEESPLEVSHVAIVPVGGLTFCHFLPLFGAGTADGQEPLHRRVACLLDADPSRKERNVPGARWKKCWPFELGQDEDSFEYRSSSVVLRSLQHLTDGCENVIIKCGRYTFEYDVALDNSSCSLLITENCANRDSLLTLMACDGYSRKIAQDLLGQTVDILYRAALHETERLHMQFAACYLTAVEHAKGEHALQLAKALRENQEKPDAKRVSFTVPAHMREVIHWVCGRK